MQESAVTHAANALVCRSQRTGIADGCIDYRLTDSRVST
jgi:hypothetical protein